MSFSSEDETFLLDNIHLKTLRRKSVRVDKINRDRWKFREYHHFTPQLKMDSERFFCYMRMDLGTVNYTGCPKIRGTTQ
jgi:hypothetical protein